MPQSNKFSFILLGIIFAITAAGFAGFIYLQNQIQLTSQPINQFTQTMQPISNQEVNPGFTIPTPTSSAAPAATPKPTPTPFVQTFPKTIYIPAGGGGSTQSTDWVDVPNDAVWIDFNSEFGSKAKAVFESFLRVDNANGTAYARLFDVTHSIAVNGSEVSLENNAQFNLVVSSNLTFWAGKNLYRVQVKSLNGSTIFLDSARIKMSY